HPPSYAAATRQPREPRHTSLGRRCPDMVPTSRPAVWVAWLPLALLVAAGCKQGPTPEVQARMDSLSQASSDRDRLMQEVAENTRLVSEISRELAKASVPAKALKITAESPLRASRDTLIQKIRYVTTRMREIEPRLKDSEQRIRQLTTLSDSLRDQLAATMQNLQGVLDNQKETIEALTNQVDQLSTQLAALQPEGDDRSTHEPGRPALDTARGAEGHDRDHGHRGQHGLL